MSPEDMDPNYLKNIFEEKLKWFYSHQWWAQIENSGACDSYSIFKMELKIEPYLTLLEPRYHIPLCKFRTNNHRLPIVTGRYNNVNRIHRICELCNTDDLGDEYHYLLKCNHFKSKREELLDVNYLENAHTLKMKQLMNSQNTSELIRLSKFITIILDHFKNQTEPKSPVREQPSSISI